MMVRISILLLISLYRIQAQLNLGSFNIGKNPLNGDLDLGFGQGGSLFGLGGDRSMNFNIGQGHLGAKSDGGLMIGGQRLGLESLLGIDENRGLNLGSFLNSGGQSALGSGLAPPTGGPKSQQAPDPIAGFIQNLAGLLKPPGGSGDKSPSGGLVLPPEGIGLSKGADRMPWEGDGDGSGSNGPTPPTSVDGDELEGFGGGDDDDDVDSTTTSTAFPTLVNMGWSTNQSATPGFGPQPRGRVNTEGGWSSGVSTQRPRENVNSGEASKKLNGRRHGGPPPPEGLVDIASANLRKTRMH